MKKVRPRPPRIKRRGRKAGKERKKRRAGEKGKEVELKKTLKNSFMKVLFTTKNDAGLLGYLFLLKSH